VGLNPSFLAADPLGIARARSYPPIEALSEFEEDERDPGPDELEEYLVHPPRLILQHSLGHLDSSGSELLDPPAAHERVRIAAGDDDTGDPGSNDPIGARWGLSVVGARFERHVDRRSAPSLPSFFQREHLGVRTAEPLVPPLADDLSGPDYDRTDDRIRVGVALAAMSELEGEAHVALIKRVCWVHWVVGLRR